MTLMPRSPSIARLLLPEETQSRNIMLVRPTIPSTGFGSSPRRSAPIDCPIPEDEEGDALWSYEDTRPRRDLLQHVSPNLGPAIQKLFPSELSNATHRLDTERMNDDAIRAPQFRRPPPSASRATDNSMLPIRRAVFEITPSPSPPTSRRSSRDSMMSTSRRGSKDSMLCRTMSTSTTLQDVDAEHAAASTPALLRRCGDPSAADFDSQREGGSVTGKRPAPGPADSSSSSTPERIACLTVEALADHDRASASEASPESSRLTPTVEACSPTPDLS